MTPPGLTCPRCQSALYPHLATTTDDGFAHIHRCQRVCVIEGCGRKHHANGYCSAHNHRLMKYGDPTFVSDHRPRVDHVERAEDVRWMADTGECLSGAAARLGITPAALEVWGRRHDRESLARLIAREPKDHNRVPSGVSIAELTGDGERRARQPYRMKRRKGVAA